MTSEPTTEAGRALVGDLKARWPERGRSKMRQATEEALPAIEAQAAAQERARLTRWTSSEVHAMTPKPDLTALDAARADDSIFDGTDAAHPAWWRGSDHASAVWRQRLDAKEVVLQTTLRGVVELERRLDAARAERNGYAALAAEYASERDAARADADRLAAAGTHKTECGRWPSEWQPCDCGWSVALAAHKEARP